MTAPVTIIPAHTFLTEEQARSTWLCPTARTFGTDPAKIHCRGAACAVWRWKPIMASDPRVLSAIKREMPEVMKEDPTVSETKARAMAEQRVMLNPRGYILNEKPEVGCCGLGGLPG